MVVEPMIPLQSPCQRPLRAGRPKLGIRRTTVLLLAVSLVAWAACDKVPLTAPTGSTITLHVNPTTVAASGSADVTAVVLESGGTNVQNGTQVSFYTTLGTIEPSQGQTRNGAVTVKFRAGAQTGDAGITAVSGAATLTAAVTITVTS
jgi:hypothetical protein